MDNNKCSFCGKTKKQVNLLITGINANICDVCVEQAQNILREEFTTRKNFDFSSVKLLKPIDIHKFLDLYVIAQDEAKKFLSVSVYNHYKRLIHLSNKRKEDIEIEKSNVILLVKQDRKNITGKDNCKDASCTVCYS